MHSIRSYFKLVAILSVVMVIVGYSALKSRDLFIQDPIRIESPVNGSASKEELINIEGNADNVASISVNGFQVFIDEDGFFSFPYILAPGYNIVEVVLKDKFGRIKRKTVEIIYKA